MGDIKADDYVFMPVEEATAPATGGFFQHFVDAWWTVHPEHGLMFFNPKTGSGRRRFGRYGSPQCNTDERISRKVGLDTAGSVFEGIEIRLFPSVWVPIEISDYTR